MAVTAVSSISVKKEPTRTTSSTTKTSNHDWPRGKNCNVCNRAIATQYCTSCKYCGE
jgi:hypothetical protein